MVECKSGAEEAAHGIQMALQAMLVAQEYNIPATTIQRYAIYVKSNGKFKMQHFTNRRDFDGAADLIRRFC